MKKIFFSLLIVLVFSIDCFSQDTLPSYKNKQIIYEYIINDFKKISMDKYEKFIVNVDFDQETPTVTSAGIGGYMVKKVELINHPIRFKMDNIIFYDNLSYDCVSQTGIKHPFLNKLYFLDIKTPLDKWLNLNCAELKSVKDNVEIKIYMPVIYKSYDFKTSDITENNFIYEFVYRDGLIKFNKKVAF